PTSLKDVVRTHVVPRPRMEDILPPSTFCPVMPDEFDRVVLAMMAYDPDNRPFSAREVLAVLDSVRLRSEADAGRHPGSGSLPERVRVDGGIYYLGSQAESPMVNEKPYRRLILSPFLMDVHSVSNAAYRAFTRALGHRPSALADDPVFGRDDHPVVGVSWEDACDYAAWIGGRLPTEAEWECAARGGQRFAKYPWGEETPTKSQANIGRLHPSTTPVKAYPEGRNPLGLFDMCGNVWEWCADSYDASWYGRLRHEDCNPRNESPTATRSLRGGGFDSACDAGRCAFRSSADPSERRRDVGFRVVYDL
ncbi:MAG: SUMF1/EgtB/PvdO family nonheme iron enzyme, partial [Alphaproteobacteria bacterium]|nr:SUMF1/EgtB/PvdO family nonheme iron enzyme [Alphaproteobacteria bacterium]